MSALLLRSEVDRVTAHPTSAHVVRRAPLPAVSGQQTVRLLDLPLLMRSGSLRVRVEGDGGTLVRFDEVADLDVTLADDAPTDLSTLVQAAADARAHRLRLEARARALQSVIATLEHPLTADGSAPGGPPDALALADVADARDAVVDRYAEQHHALRLQLRAAQRTEELAQKQLANARSGGRVRAVRGLEAVVVCTGAATGQLVVDYFVDGVRWAPAYALDVDGTHARLSTSARIAQATGERWTHASLALSTVNVQRTSALPKLPAWRIGRAQPEVSTGWRPLPSDLPTLFGGVDAAGRPPGPARAPGAKQTTALGQRLRPHLSDAEALLEHLDAPVFHGAAGGSAPVMGMAAEEDADDELEAFFDDGPPLPPPAMAAPKVAAARPPPPPAPMRSAAPTPGGGGPPPMQAKKKRGRGRPARPSKPRPPRSGPPTLLDYGWLRLPPWTDKKRRGGLHPVTLDSALAEFVEERGLGAGTVRSIGQALSHLRNRRATLERTSLPSGFTDSQAAGFHHRTPFGPRVTLPPDGRFRGIQVHEAEAPVRRVYRVVPRQDPTVQEILELDNPTGGPLGAGPLRVMEGGGVRASTALPAVAAGGRLRVSLGPEERLRVARNAEMQEETRGMLGGDRVLIHRIDITVANRLSRPARVEVFEALPDDSADAGVDVRLDPSTPPPERGPGPHGHTLDHALRWTLTIPPGEERRIRWGYSITISSRAELVGGNRREP